MELVVAPNLLLVVLQVDLRPLQDTLLLQGTRLPQGIHLLRGIHLGIFFQVGRLVVVRWGVTLGAFPVPHLAGLLCLVR